MKMKNNILALLLGCAMVAFTNGCISTLYELKHTRTQSYKDTTKLINENSTATVIDTQYVPEGAWVFFDTDGNIKTAELVAIIDKKIGAIKFFNSHKKRAEKYPAGSKHNTVDLRKEFRAFIMIPDSENVVREQ